MNLNINISSSVLVVSFWPPEYGAKCVRNYDIILVTNTQKREFQCNATTDYQVKQECTIPLGNETAAEYNVYNSVCCDTWN